MNTRQMLADIAIKEFHCDAEKIVETSTIKDLGIDSLTLLEFIFRVEEVFGIRIDNDQADKLVTLEDIARLVEQLQTPAPTPLPTAA